MAQIDTNLCTFDKLLHLYIFLFCMKYFQPLEYYIVAPRPYKYTEADVRPKIRLVAGRNNFAITYHRELSHLLKILNDDFYRL